MARSTQAGLGWRKSNEDETVSLAWTPGVGGVMVMVVVRSVSVEAVVVTAVVKVGSNRRTWTNLTRTPHWGVWDSTSPGHLGSVIVVTVVVTMISGVMLMMDEV